MKILCSNPEAKRGNAISLHTPPKWWTSDHWATPPEFVEELEQEFGQFDLDPCCRPETAKAPRYYTEEQDGLAKPWIGKVFLNPPYSNPSPWMQKTILEISTNRASLVVALIPASTDTRWFHYFVKDQAEIRFIEGRIRFYGWNGTPIGSPKQPNLLAIYRAVGTSPTVEVKTI